MADNDTPVLDAKMRAALRINLDKLQTARKLYANDHSDQVARRLRTAESHVGQVEFVEALWTRVKELEADVEEGVFPGWQSYEEWIGNNRTNPKALAAAEKEREEANGRT